MSFQFLFWLSLLFWSLLAATKTPWLEIESIPVSSKDVVNIALAGLCLFLPTIKNRSITGYRRAWHHYLPILTVAVVLYAAWSVQWSGMNVRDTMAMLYTLIFTVSGCLLGYYLIAKRDFQSVGPFLWKLTVFLAAVGLMYTVQSFFSLGLTTAQDYQSEQFGIQRVRGPLFGSTTGFFILVPALGFAIQEVVQCQNISLFKVSVIFSLVISIIGSGSRTGLILLAVFFILLILFIKNKKQTRIALTLMIVITLAAFLLFFSKAKTDRLQSLEDTTRSDTYLTSFQIIENRSEEINIFGSGYGSYWPWYLPDILEDGATREGVLNPYGSLLYHPHSTFLLCIVELGIPGFIYYAILWIVLFRLLLRNLQQAPFPIFSCGVFASGFSMFFDFFLFKGVQVNTLWWIYLFGALALNYSRVPVKINNNILTQNKFSKD